MANGLSKRENESDWKVYFTLDREALREEIRRLQSWLDKPWQDISCIVDAADELEAEQTAREYKSRMAGLPLEFVRNTRARRLPC